MKKLVAACCLVVSIAGASAQGLVNFANTPNSLVSVQEPVVNGPISVMTGPAGSYYFGLFFGLPNIGAYTFTGIYATNTGVDGLFSGGAVAVPGWAAGASQSYFVAGWAASMGHDFNPDWFRGADFFGASVNGSGIAGNGGSLPILNLFDGGGNTIQGGFALRNNLVPEPSVPSLIAVGAGLLLLRRIGCQKQGSRSP